MATCQDSKLRLKLYDQFEKILQIFDLATFANLLHSMMTDTPYPNIPTCAISLLKSRIVRQEEVAKSTELKNVFIAVFDYSSALYQNTSSQHLQMHHSILMQSLNLIRFLKSKPDLFSKVHLFVFCFPELGKN
jgi:hypothetical protein